MESNVHTDAAEPTTSEAPVIALSLAGKIVRELSALLFAKTFWSFVREFSPICGATGPYSVHPP